MGKKLPYTPNSKITVAIRQIWLRSRERAQALKNAKYCCERCGKKQSKAKGREQKVEVHHKKGIDWTGLVQLLRERVLQTPDDLQVLCPDCHNKEHENEKNNISRGEEVGA
jgi:predicted HNH restriction endonuclease